MKHIPTSHGATTRTLLLRCPSTSHATSSDDAPEIFATSIQAYPEKQEASRSPDARRYATSIERGLTHHIHPMALKAWIRNEALSCISRFRYVRAVDIAAACFANRPFPAAREAARRALAGLLADGSVLKYKTKIPKTFYALSTSGARHLQTLGIDARASTRSAANLSNAEHLLWSNFLVIACEARRLRAMTEAEILAALNSRRQGRESVQGLLEVIEARTNKKRVQLRPDAIALEDDGITWFEVDASRRSPVRLERLSLLVKSVGKNLTRLEGRLDIQPPSLVLRRVVVKVTEQALFNRVLGRLRKTVADTNTPEYVMTVDNNLRSLQEQRIGVFSVLRAEYDERSAAQVDVCVGHVIVELLPTGLPNFKGDGSWKAKPAYWFEEGGLPYRRPSDDELWAPPKTPFEL